MAKSWQEIRVERPPREDRVEEHRARMDTRSAPTACEKPATVRVAECDYRAADSNSSAALARSGNRDSHSPRTLRGSQSGRHTRRSVPPSR